MFQQELFGTAQSIVEDVCSLYHGTKSDILKRLDNIAEPSLSGSSSNVILFELSAFIRVKTNSNCKNFNEFALLLYHNIAEPSISGSSNNAILFELSAFIRVKTNSNCKNFNEFALLLYHHFSKPSEGGNRCEIISDRYFDGSLEEGTRKKRGEEASRLIFNGETLIPKDFSEHLLRN